MIKKIAPINSIFIMAFILTATYSTEKEFDLQQPSLHLIQQDQYNQERETVKNIISSIEANIVPGSDVLIIEKAWEYWEQHQMCEKFICKHDIWYIHKTNVVFAKYAPSYLSCTLKSIEKDYNSNNKI